VYASTPMITRMGPSSAAKTFTASPVLLGHPRYPEHRCRTPGVAWSL
jgi:hypothetical protein